MKKYCKVRSKGCPMRDFHSNECRMFWKDCNFKTEDIEYATTGKFLVIS